MSIPEGLLPHPEGAVPGDLVAARAWKYDGGAHWVVPGRYLGADRHGDWVFQPAGSFVARPGLAFHAESDAVCLFPRGGDWVATFYDEDHPDGVRLYIDVSTSLGWRPLRPAGWEANSIDMDLDVVDSAERGLYLDDEDEFTEHAGRYGYPEELVRRMRASADSLLDDVGARRAPFDQDTAGQWFAAGRRLDRAAAARS
ncbi:DUF402 domain-containing protein [Zafaria sp. J156]|uniref:DUF402 domain-containing protein n=1 Tax=Zafaria sp. J156 TaxID=3116490 RepID=UPI002E78DCD1|nr:DUF402 domain-containing protein [Zafaria sp. J156]MEE1620112.1 DUF402 domain-containing protein [Zafaria sp. J156]